MASNKNNSNGLKASLPRMQNINLGAKHNRCRSLSTPTEQLDFPMAFPTVSKSGIYMNNQYLPSLLNEEDDDQQQNSGYLTPNQYSPEEDEYNPNLVRNKSFTNFANEVNQQAILKQEEIEEALLKKKFYNKQSFEQYNVDLAERFKSANAVTMLTPPPEVIEEQRRRGSTTSTASSLAIEQSIDDPEIDEEEDVVEPKDKQLATEQLQIPDFTKMISPMNKWRQEEGEDENPDNSFELSKTYDLDDPLNNFMTTNDNSCHDDITNRSEEEDEVEDINFGHFIEFPAASMPTQSISEIQDEVEYYPVHEQDRFGKPFGGQPEKKDISFLGYTPKTGGSTNQFLKALSPHRQTTRHRRSGSCPTITSEVGAILGVPMTPCNTLVSHGSSSSTSASASSSRATSPLRYMGIPAGTPIKPYAPAQALGDQMSKVETSGSTKSVRSSVVKLCSRMVQSLLGSKKTQKEVRSPYTTTRQGRKGSMSSLSNSFRQTRSPHRLSLDGPEELKSNDNSGGIFRIGGRRKSSLVEEFVEPEPVDEMTPLDHAKDSPLLRTACTFGDLGLAEFAIEQANLESKKNKLFNELDETIERASGSRSTSASKTRSKSRTNSINDTITELGGEESPTPLQLATYYGHTALVKYLVEKYDADVNEKSKSIRKRPVVSHINSNAVKRQNNKLTTGRHRRSKSYDVSSMFHDNAISTLVGSSGSLHLGNNRPVSAERTLGSGTNLTMSPKPILKKLTHVESSPNMSVPKLSYDSYPSEYIANSGSSNDTLQYMSVSSLSSRGITVNFDNKSFDDSPSDEDFLHPHDAHSIAVAMCASPLASPLRTADADETNQGTPENQMIENQYPSAFNVPRTPPASKESYSSVGVMSHDFNEQLSAVLETSTVNSSSLAPTSPITIETDVVPYESKDISESNKLKTPASTPVFTSMNETPKAITIRNALEEASSQGKQVQFSNVVDFKSPPQLNEDDDEVFEDITAKKVKQLQLSDFITDARLLATKLTELSQERSQAEQNVEGKDTSYMMSPPSLEKDPSQSSEFSIFSPVNMDRANTLSIPSLSLSSSLNTEDMPIIDQKTYVNRDEAFAQKGERLRVIRRRIISLLNDEKYSNNSKNHDNSYGKTALHFAVSGLAMVQSEKVVMSAKALYDQSIFNNVATSEATAAAMAAFTHQDNNDVPLAATLEAGHEEIIQFLLDNGADPTARDESNARPVDYLLPFD